MVLHEVGTQHAKVQRPRTRVLRGHCPRGVWQVWESTFGAYDDWGYCRHLKNRTPDARVPATFRTSLHNEAWSCLAWYWDGSPDTLGSASLHIITWVRAYLCHLKRKNKLPYNPAIPLLGIHTEETRIERDMYTPMFIAALFIIARTWKQPRCPSADEWIRKLWYIYTMPC